MSGKREGILKYFGLFVLAAAVFGVMGFAVLREAGPGSPNESVVSSSTPEAVQVTEEQELVTEVPIETPVSDVEPDTVEELPESTSEPEPVADTSTVVGRVVAIPGSQPVPGTEVFLKEYPYGGDDRKTTTDSEGAFLFENVVPGPYITTVSHPRYVPVVLKGEVFRIGDNEERSIEIEVERGGVIEGRVTDADTGEGISGIILDALDSYSGIQLRKGIVTDSEGNFRIEGLVYREYVVDVVGDPSHLYLPEKKPYVEGATLFNPIRERLDVAPGIINRVDIELEKIPYIHVTGIVVDPEGSPVADVMVRVDTTNQIVFGEAKSESGGHFDILVPGVKEEWGPVHNWYVQVKDEKYASERLGDFQEPEEVVDLELIAYPAGIISGIVVDSKGNPVPGRKIKMCWAESVMSLLSEPKIAETDSNGVFSFEGLSPDDYWLWAKVAGVTPRDMIHRDGWTQTDMPIFIEEWGKVVFLTKVTLGPGESAEDVVVKVPDSTFNTISGHLVDSEGQPFSNGTVLAEGPLSDIPVGEQLNRYTLNRKYPDPDTTRYEVRPDEGGNFFFELKQPGLYFIEARPNYSDDYAEGGIVSAGTSGLEIKVPKNGAIEGRVVDAETRRPIPRFLVVVKHPSQPLNHLNAWDRAEKVYDEEGIFIIESRSQGLRDLCVLAEGYKPVAIPVEIKNEQTIKGMVVELEVAPRIEGVVSDSQGHPVNNAAIFVGVLPEYPDYRNAVHTDENGVFALLSEPETPAFLTVTHPDYALCTVDVEPDRNGEASVNAVLEAGGNIEGTVTVNGRQFYRKVLLRVVGNERFPILESKQGGMVNTGYSFEHVPAGPVELWVDRYKEYPAEATISSDVSTELYFEIDTSQQ